MFDSSSRVSTETPCKCCAGSSLLCGVVDFSRGGADQTAGRKIDPYSGISVHYYRCAHCGFTFTPAFDDWTPARFSEAIYNADYARQDPDYLGARPARDAQMIAEHFPELASVELLDFGSGSGLLEQQLRARGFAHVRSHDPFSHPHNADALNRKYRVIFAFEVFEHHVDPRELVHTFAGMLDEDGAIFLSTLFVPESVPQQGIETWWYCMPRNGHLSFFTPASLALFASYSGLKAGSFSDGLHFLYKARVPAWAARMQHTLHDV